MKNEEFMKQKAKDMTIEELESALIIKKQQKLQFVHQYLQRIRIELEFDKDKLGNKWMNSDNLDLLLYTDAFTKKELLKVVKYEEIESK